MKSELIRYTDRALLDIVLKLTCEINPHVKIGEKMDGPVSLARNGKIIKDNFDTAFDKQPNFIPFSILPKDFEIPPAERNHVLQATSLYLSIDTLESYLRTGKIVESLYEKLTFKKSAFDDQIYLHPYVVCLENREILENYEVGDMMQTTVMNVNTFEPRKIDVVLTQKMIDDLSSIAFRFALTN